MSGEFMLDLFYTLFKYKEKAQKDELGYYPEKVEVRAFPERRYLWTSRFFVVLSCLSICLSMLLGSILIIIIPLKTIRIVPLQINYELHQVNRMSPSVASVFAGDLVTESLMAQYITERYTIENGTDREEYLDKLKLRLGENEFVYLASAPNVYRVFDTTERPYAEFLQQRGVHRKVKVLRIYPVSMDFWQVKFQTIDTAPDMPADDFMTLMKVNIKNAQNPLKPGEPLISNWVATIRMRFNFSKYENKDLGIKNPFGLTIISYDLSYLGNNIKTMRD